MTIYEKDTMCQVDINKLSELQLQLDDIYENMARGAFVHSRRKWLELGEKNTKYFHNLEKRNACINNIHKLKINHSISENPQEISHFVEEFYSKLYTEPDTSYDALPFLSSLKSNARQIDRVQKSLCDQNISLDEVKKNISRLKNNKSPGNDGLTGEFFKSLSKLHR